MSNGNDVKSIFKKIHKQNDELKIKNEVAVKEEILDKDSVLANYSFDYDVDEEVINYLKDVTFELHKETHNYYTKIGKLLSEAQEKLANNKSGIFRKWFENIGLKKDFVYDNIGRYKYIVGLSDNIKVEKVESLPVTLTYEISKESCPDSIREKVISGEIKTKAELKRAIKEVQEIEEEEILEAEIIEKASLDKFIMGKQCILMSLEEAFNKIRNGANTPENLEIFLKVQELLNKVK